jgi:hypothetical protein
MLEHTFPTCFPAPSLAAGRRAALRAAPCGPCARWSCPGGGGASLHCATSVRARRCCLTTPCSCSCSQATPPACARSACARLRQVTNAVAPAQRAACPDASGLLPQTAHRLAATPAERAGAASAPRAASTRERAETDCNAAPQVLLARVRRQRSRTRRRARARGVRRSPRTGLVAAGRRGARTVARARPAHACLTRAAWPRVRSRSTWRAFCCSCTA